MRKTFTIGILCALFLAGMLFCIPAGSARAESEPVATGDGWSLSADGVLTVTVDADARTFQTIYKTAGKDRALREVVFAEGVTKASFFDFRLSDEPSPCVDNLTIPSTMTEISFGWGPLQPARITVAKGNPVYYVKNGLLIDRSQRAVVFGGYSLTHAEVPDGIVEINDSAFFWHENLRSISLPEGLRYIDEYAFYGCTALADVRLPLSLRGICRHAFTDCTALESLVLPPNVRMYVFLDGDRCIFTDSGIRTLVFTDSHINFCKGVVDSCGALERLVFLRRPPEEYTVWMFNRLMENTDGKAEILYRDAYRVYWSPNGETAWNGVPTRAMTEQEEAEIRKLAGDLWDAPWTNDAMQAQGWTLDAYSTLRINSDAGMEDFRRIRSSVYGNTVYLEGTVTRLPEIFCEGFTGGLEEIYIGMWVSEIEDNALDVFKRIYIAHENPWFHADGGRLIETATGRVLRGESLSAPPPTPTLAPTPPTISAPALTPTPESLSMSTPLPFAVMTADPAETAMPGTDSSEPSAETTEPGSETADPNAEPSAPTSEPPAGDRKAPVPVSVWLILPALAVAAVTYLAVRKNSI